MWMASASSQSRWASVGRPSRVAVMIDSSGALDVQSALFGGRIFPPPSSRANMFAGRHGARAGRAADARIALVVQPVVGHGVGVEVGPDLLLAPVGERIEFFQPVGG